MKICGLNIPHPEDRDDLIKILVNAGYKVSVWRKKRTNFCDNDETTIIVEENDNG